VYARAEQISSIKDQIVDLKQITIDNEREKRDNEPIDRREHNIMIDFKHEYQKLKIERRQLNAGQIPNA
jgi:hypothetical protein